MSGLPAWARVGAKVVRRPEPTLSSGKGRTPGAAYPEPDGVYTVRKIVFHSTTGNPLFLLVEVRNPPGCDGIGTLEPGFDVRHFRPVAPKTLEDDLTEHFAHYLKTDHRATRKAGIDA